MLQSPSWEATGLPLVKKFPAFHETRSFITALTNVRHLSLSWASPIQSIYLHPTSWRSILTLSTHLRLGLPSGLLPSGFPTKTLYTPFSSHIRATCPAHLLLNIISRNCSPCHAIHFCDRDWKLTIITQNDSTGLPNHQIDTPEVALP